MPEFRERQRFTDDQMGNARQIVSVGRSLGASNRDLLIALMTAFQESGLRNLSYGDRDSVGLFQQRNAWGSRADRMDPVKSARMFFLGGGQGQRGLFDFKNRNGMSLTQAAQAVQVSVYPNAYAKHEERAQGMLQVLGSSVSDLPQAPETTVPGPTDTLNLFDQPAALVEPPSGKPAGIEAVAAPGAEAGDEMPDLSGDMLGMFDPAGGAGGGATFEELFPKQPGVAGGARARVAQLARQLLGTNYVWGGSDPDIGLDCSGYTQYVLKQVGVNLPRVSYQQANYGKRVGLNQLQVGDLVAWDNSSRNRGADHIAIYLGNGRIAEAPRPGLSVRIRQLDDNEGAWGVALNY